MSKNLYRSAMGKGVDMDALRLSNEEAVSVGNMKVNARGDELGSGGEIARPKKEVMGEYYKNNAIYTEERVEQIRHTNARAGARLTTEGPDPDVFQNPVPNNAQHTADPMLAELAQEDAREEAVSPAKNLRGSLADAVAKTAVVNQELLKPKSNKTNGPSRI
jgi:hypothetical protein